MSFLFIIIVGSLCFLAPYITPYDYSEQNLMLGSQGPTGAHWFGTDLLGRDLLTRILYGGRISFLVGLLATSVSLLIGVSYGAIAGYFGGNIDRIMMRLVDIIASLPYIIFVILLMVLVKRGLLALFLAIGSIEWLTMARLVRSQIIFLKGQPFIQASQSLGQSTWGILLKHMLPNTVAIIIVCATLTIPSAMLMESTLSFLGLGIQPPMTSWGDLIRTGTSTLETTPWQLLFPCLFFSSTLLALNFLGDGLRDALDPTYRFKTKM